MNQHKGFSLLELMITMAVIGLIAGIAWPMFTEQGRVNNRTDAILATNSVSLALAQFQSDSVNGYVWDANPGAVTIANAHNRYLPNVAVGTASGTPADNVCAQNRGFRWVPVPGRYESCRGLYSIAVVVADADGDGVGEAFTITTAAIAGRGQDQDEECASFTLDSNGVKGHIATGTPATDQSGSSPDNSDGVFHSTRRCWSST